MEVLTKEDGLLSNRIEDIEQDSSGFIWVVTSAGLSRYNGTTFYHYLNEDLGNHFFKPESAMRLFRDSHGGIWTSTASGAILSYSAELDMFMVQNDSTSRLPSAGISYLEDSVGNFWIGTLNEGLCYWNRKSGYLKRYTKNDHKDSLPDNLIIDLSPGYENGMITVSTTKGNCIFNPADGKFYRLWYRSENPDDTYKHNVMRDLLETDDAIYGGSFGGLHITDKSDFSTQHLFANGSTGATLNYNSIWEMVEDPEGRIWIATYGGGVNIYNPKSKRFSYITKENSALREDNLRGIFRDRDNSIWLLTDNTGLVKVDIRKNWIAHYRFDELGIDGVMGVYSSPDSTLYIGANGGGMLTLDLRSREIWRLVHDPNKAGTIAYDHVSSVERDEAGNLWIGTAGGGLNYFDSISGKISHFKFKPGEPSISENAISKLHLTDSVLWYGTYRTGYGTYNPDTRVFSNYIFPNKSYRESLEVRDIQSDASGRVWILHDQGVVMYDNTRADFINLINPAKSEMPVNHFSFTSFFEEASGEVILLNEANEIIKVKYHNPVSVVYDNIDLPEPLLERHHLTDIISWQDSMAWLLSDEGLIRWVVGTEQFQSFDKDDGFVGNEFYKVTREGDGPMTIVSDLAIHILDLERYHEIVDGPPVHLEGVSILNRPVHIGKPDSIHQVSLERHINLMEELELDYGHREFSVEFAALQFYAPGASIYRYRLLGFNNQWLQNGKDTRVSYTNLNPGKYTFEVQASIAPDIWGPVKHLDIKINPPFWRTWWFVLFVIIFSAAVLYFIHRYRLQKALAIANLRNQIAQDLHDDIGSSLTKIALYSSLLEDDGNDVQKNGFLSNIGDLSREVIGQMSDIVWSVDHKNDTAGNLISRMREFATETLEACRIDLEFKTRNIDEKSFIDPLFRQNFYLIFKEAINNICKHSEATKTEVVIEFIEGKYKMRISDNGQGINAPNKVFSGSHSGMVARDYSARGNGMLNMHRRAERINMQFDIFPQDGGGTVILLK